MAQFLFPGTVDKSVIRVSVNRTGRWACRISAYHPSLYPQVKCNQILYDRTVLGEKRAKKIAKRVLDALLCLQNSTPRSQYILHTSTDVASGVTENLN